MLRGGPVNAPARQRRAQLASFPAPVAGWVSNRNLAVPTEQGMAQGAEMLDNFFPTATGAILRRGSRTYAQLGDGSLPVTTMFKYVVGNNRKLFASTATTVYDISAVTQAYNYSIGLEDEWTLALSSSASSATIGQDSTVGLEVIEGALGGNWSTVQFATTGGVFLIGVNGASEGFIYDGTTFYPNVKGGVWALNYDAKTVAFVEGGTLTGGTSAATALIRKVIDNGATGTLWLSGIVGVFADNEAISGSTGGAAVADGVVSSLSPGVAFPVGSTLTTADLSYVWVYKNRLWFIQKESLTVWYLPVDQIGGELVPFYLGSEFGRGGSLVIGQGWSLQAGDSGGLSEQNVFITNEGEVAVYQGVNPAEASSWTKVGVYRIGVPLGSKALIRAGGDLVISTNIGFIALSQAIQVDFAALAPTAVSYPIEVAWNEAVQQRGMGWSAVLWPEHQMTVVAPPTVGGTNPVVFVANARTGAWAPFTNWNVTCMETFNGRLLFGGPEGFIKDAMVGGTDDGIPYTGVFMPLFADQGSPTSLKAARIARATMRSGTVINERVSCRFDFDRSLPPPPDVAPVPVGNEWDNAIWDQSVWDGARNSVISQRRHSVSGRGYRIAPVLQVTSGSPVPLDVEVVSLDVTYMIGDIFT